MRTNIEIDDELMAEAMKASGTKTKRETVTYALQELVLSRSRRRALEEMKGMGWDGDLDQMRNDWTEDTDWGLK